MNTIGAIDEEIQHLTFRPANDMGICRKYGGALPQFAGHNNRTTDFPGRRGYGKRLVPYAHFTMSSHVHLFILLSR